MPIAAIKCVIRPIAESATAGHQRAMIPVLGVMLLSVAVERPISIEISSVPQEEMARRLEAAVRGTFARDSRFIAVERGGGGSVTVALPGRLGWQRRLDWTEIHYQARLSFSDGRTQVIAGHCWNWNLAVCAKQIADATAAFGSH